MDSLIQRLAELDESAADRLGEDSELLQLKVHLESLVPNVTAPVSLDHVEEPACRRAVEAAMALGRSWSSSSSSSSSGTGDSQREVECAVQQNQILGEIRDYKLLEKLGEGGMGAVYKALHTRLNKVVALKVLPPDKTRDAAALARFEREMQAVGRLQHPNIVAAHDAGEVDGQHFLVMELVDGEDLSQIVKRQGSLDVADACEVVRQAAVGLQEAHEHAMVHRDVKPSNLMLAVRRRKKKTTATVKILDLGLALLDERHTGGGELTSTGQLMGTIDYMAPEQATDTHNVDIRADVYALGATLYKLLTGVAPLADKKYDSAVKKIIALVNEQPPSIGAKRPDLPAELIALVDALIAKRPDDRPATPEDVAEALAPFCAGHNLAALAPERPGDAAGDERGGTVSLSAASVETSPTFLDSQAPTPPERTIDAPLGKPAKQPSSGRRRPPRKRLLIAAAAGAFFLLAAACGVLVLLVQTPGGGTLRIEIADPDIEVSIKGGEVLLAGVGKEDISFKPGNHVLHVKRGDFEFDTTTLELKRNETVVVKVEWLADGTLQALRNGRVIGSKSAPAETAGLPKSAPRLAVTPFSSEEAKRHQQAWADYLGVPVQHEVDLGGDEKLRMVLIPPGEFMMGSTEAEQERFLAQARKATRNQSGDYRIRSEGPRHLVRITKPFRLSAHEVTFSQFRRFVDETDYKTEAERDGLGGYGRLDGQWGQAPRFVWNSDLGFETQRDADPVVNVSWNDAKAFCDWLTNTRGGATFLLPSEAQWAYACRAGTTTVWQFGDDDANLGAYAWFETNSSGEPRAVGQLRPNAFGLYDMLGNVYELCLDRYAEDSYAHSKVSDPTGSPTGSKRVARGGSWRTPTWWCRSASRYGYDASFRNDSLGFRVATTVETTTESPPRVVKPTKTWRATPKQQAFFDAVDRLPPKEQVEAVRQKLQEVNPGFDGKVEHTMFQGRVHEVSFSTDQVAEIWPVRALPDLRNLICAGSGEASGRLTDLAPLHDTRIEILVCSNNQIRDLTPLKGMPIRFLVCNGTRVSDLSPLEGMQLQKLWFSNTQVADLSPLAGMPLSDLNCETTPVVDFSPLAGMPLTSVYGSYSQVSDLSPLKDSPLTLLQCNATPITDLGPLEDLPLTNLQCASTKVADLSPLKNMPLEQLQIWRTQVADLTPLKGMSIQHLSLDLQMYHPFNESVIGSLPLKSIGEVHATQRTPQEYWQGIEARRRQAEVFADETANLPVNEQVATVSARIEQLNGGAIGLSGRVVGEDAVDEAVVTLTEETHHGEVGDPPDITPIMAFKKLRKLTLIGGPFWLDISCVRRLPLEELTVSDDIALKNSVTLREMDSLKIINSRSANEFLDSLAP